MERVILRCLEKDPAKRPPSALAVAAALPGADPLAAALAAGETPSPELVAEAGDVGALPPAVAWAYLASVVISLGLVVWMPPSTQISGIASLPKSPELLRERARDVIGNLGFSGTARDSNYGFTLRRDLIEYVAEHDESPDRWQRLSAVDASLVRFWYRQSPRDLVPQRLTSFLASAHDPPPLISGMVNLELDPRGRLRAFSTVPPELDDAKRSGSQTDWGALFGEAGFDLAEFEPVEPEWNPASYTEELAAWKGVYPSSPSTPIRVEAAAYRGKPIAFRIIEPWTTPDRMDLAATSSPGRPIGRVFSPLAVVVHIGANVLAILGGALLARRNLRLGRGDRRGAFRLALYMFSLVMLHWFFGAHHVLGSKEVDVLFGALSIAAFSYLHWLGSSTSPSSPT